MTAAASAIGLCASLWMAAQNPGGVGTPAPSESGVGGVDRPVSQGRSDAGAVTAVPLATRLDKAKAEQAEVPVPTTFVLRNEMGKGFRLVEAHFVVDGTEVGQRMAAAGQELGRSVAPLEVMLPIGNHRVTARLVFTGRNVGLFTYLDDIRYRVESTIPFTTGHLVGPATIEVVATERPEPNLPPEQKPVLTVKASNNPNVAAQKLPVGLQPASSTGRP
jgi:hypothetical protein